jgi:hypothetical protein
MDYARFNYVAQPGDGVTSFYPEVGPYDKWNAKWGYTWFPDDMSDEEIEDLLNDWVKERADDPIYFYGRQTGGKIDPRSQNEDLTNNAMEAGELGIENLKVIMSNLIEWTEEEGENFEELEELYNNIIGQWGRYMGHTLSNIGGVYENHKTYDQEGIVYSPVDESTQREAMEFLQNHAFSSPTWAFNQEILDRINQATAVETFRNAQSRVLASVVDASRIARLIEYENRTDGDTYTAFEMMDDLRNGIFSEVRSNENIDVHRRYLQRAYVEEMAELMDLETTGGGWFGPRINVSQSDIRANVRNQLTILKRDVDRALRSGGFNRVTRTHLEDVSATIEDILNGDD